MTGIEAQATPSVESPPGAGDCDLRYLLTAYLFDSLSEEGRLEVEKQLESSQRCRKELEELRETLFLLTDTLEQGAESSTGYSFETKRMERVLAASRKKAPLAFLPRPYALAAAAAILLFIGISIPLLISKSSSPLNQTASFGSFDGGGRAGGTELPPGADGLKFRLASKADDLAVHSASLAKVSQFKRRMPYEVTEDSPMETGAGEPASTAPGDIKYDPKKKRDLKRTPKILNPKIIKEPIIKRKIDEVTTDIPKGSDLNNLFNAPPPVILRKSESRPGTQGRAGRIPPPPAPAQTIESRFLDVQDDFLSRVGVDIDKEMKPDAGKPAAVRPPVEEQNRPSSRVNDVIGIGGGAAGVYGRRYAKGKLVGEENGLKGGRTSASTPRFKAAAPEAATAGRKNGKKAPASLSKKRVMDPGYFAGERDSSKQTELGKNQNGRRVTKKPPSPISGEEDYSRKLRDHRLRVDKDRGDQGGKELGSRINEARSFSAFSGKRGEEQAPEEREKNGSPGEGFAFSDEDEDSISGLVGDLPRLGRLFEQLAQKPAPSAADYRSNFTGNAWAYSLNIAKTADGYLSLGNQSGRNRQDEVFQVAAAEGQQAAGGKASIAVNEKSLNSYAWYRDLDPNLSYEQFHSRALTIPPPALGDEGLGEKGFRAKYGVNPFVATSRDHFSTFGMDVDNASWGRTLESVRNRQLPSPQTVRVEEFVNNFTDQRPGNPGNVFTVYTEGGPSPFGDHELELIQVTIKSRDLLPGERKNVVLTFAVDTSGSMATDAKLDLLKESIRRLVSNLESNDRVAIVAFSTNAYVVLPHTSVRQKSEIEAAVDSLVATGGTNVEAGIDLAYRLAAETSDRRAANRVILCSDGVANLGAKGPEAVLKRIRRYARENLISLFTYAFGSGGRQAVRGDRMLQRLADEGDGRYQYVDSASASRSIFSLPDQLQILASDAKIQVDFNPDVVSHYRLLGYEKRDIADEDFRNDKVDAGEVGPGSTVTALYEIKRSRPVGSLGRVYLRYLDTVTRRVEEYDFDLPPGILAGRLADTTDRFRLIASVAEFAELLRGSYYARNGSFGAVLELMSESGTAYKKRPDFKEIYRTVSMAQGLGAVRTLNQLNE